MSRSAGRVLIIPKGDYDQTYTYEMLECCEYNGSSYLCKQTSTGNLPTNKTYWQKLVEVGDDFMFQDGSNASALVVGPSTKTSFMSATISKDAGADQDVSVVFSVTGSDPTLARNIRYIIASHIGDELVYIKSGGDDVKVTITSVSQAVDDSTVTAVGKLVDDVSEAISHSSTIYFFTYNNGSIGDAAFGPGAAVQEHGFASGKFASSEESYATAFGENVAAHGTNSFTTGKQTTAVGGESFAEGYQTMAWGNGSHAEGNHTDAHGNYSHAGGSNSEAGAENSFAFGDHATAYNPNEISIGAYNTNYNASGKKSLFDVGNGDSNTRSNAFTVYEDGMMANGPGNVRYKISKENGVWGYRSDDDNNFHPFTGYIELIQQVTLSTSADTIVTFTNAAISSSSTIEAFTSVYGINPSDVDADTTPGSCVVTIPKAASADTIEVKIRVS